MADKRADLTTATLLDLTNLAQNTWTGWNAAATVTLPQVPGETNIVLYTVKGTVNTDAAEDIQLRFIVEYDNGSGTDNTTHTSGMLHLDSGRFHHQVSLGLTTPIAGDGALIFKMEIWRDSNNSTSFNLSAGSLEIANTRATSGGNVYWTNTGVAPAGIFQIGDIWLNQQGETVMRWDGTQWLEVYDLSPLTQPDDISSNKVGFY